MVTVTYGGPKRPVESKEDEAKPEADAEAKSVQASARAESRALASVRNQAGVRASSFMPAK